MPATQVQLRIEIETEGAEQLTALRTELDRLGAAGSSSFAQLDTSLAAVLDKLKLSRGLVANSTHAFLDSQRQLFAGLAPLFDSFFRSVLTGSRSLRDAVKRLWSDFLDFFLGLVRRMVAAWLSGLQSIGAAGAGLRAFAPGGLGGLFGSPGLQGSAGLAPPSAGLAAMISSVGLQIAGAGVRGGNVPLGAFGGFIAGGSLVGLLTGGLLALFRRGKLKREASRTAEQGFADMQRVLAEFRRHQVDFEAALGRVNAIWTQMVEAWSRMGSVGRRSIRSQQPFFRQIVDRINEIQRAREARGQILAALAVPEFQLGGMVRAIHGQNSRVLALLHEGEAVLNRRAVQALGETQVERLNREPSRFRSLETAGDQFYITINAVDGESVERWLSRNEARLVRFLRRAARDRGLPPPV